MLRMDKGLDSVTARQATRRSRNRGRQARRRQGAIALLLACFTAAATSYTAVAGPALASESAAVQPDRDESAQGWFARGKQFVARAKALQPITNRAKNVILFIGDGMGVSTVTAARILEGQLRGETGEENLLSFEKLPYVSLVKTYNTDQQVPDSAGTMSAIVTGIKTRAGVLSVGPAVTRGSPGSAKTHQAQTVFELAERAGLSTGIVSTTDVTHATPAACYAHSPERSWQDDAALSPVAKRAGFPDVARQLIEFKDGNGLDVVLGGGRSRFMTADQMDPEYATSGRRGDGRRLLDEWLARKNSAYVWNKALFDAVNPDETDRLLGLFEPLDMKFESDRRNAKTLTPPGAESKSAIAAGEPSLSEMTAKAIDILRKNAKGFVLMVEGGRIDHAHHFTNAHRALVETIEFAQAVRVAIDKTDRTDTLIVVTADHSHVFTMGGYNTRGNPILGKVRGNDEHGYRSAVLSSDLQGRPYTTLGYANGPGYVNPTGRIDLTNVDTQAKEYLQETTVQLPRETHAGEDVPLYADGPWAHLFHGVIEQHVIFHVMVEALGLSDIAHAPGKN